MKQAFAVALLSIGIFAGGCGKKDDDQDQQLPPADDPNLRLSEEIPLPMRGYKSINNLIKNRMLDDPDFELVHYLQKPDAQRDQAGGSILPLFGGYSGRGTTMSNQSAVPGTMNMLLWFSVIDALAVNLSNHCNPTADSAGKLTLTSNLTAQVATICNPELDPHDGLAALWDHAMRYDGTPYLKEQWLTWLKAMETAPDAQTPTSESRTAMLRDAVVTALFSAEFLAGR